MKVLLLGGDGYIGFALYQRLIHKGYKVFVIDNLSRRRWVSEVGSISVTPIAEFRQRFKQSLCSVGDITSYFYISSIIKRFKPEVIVNLAQQPSAPFSMSSPERAVETQRNNIAGGLNVLWAMKEYAPEAHLVTLGTLGEYGDWIYDGVKIPESEMIEVEYEGKTIRIPTPKFPGSFYHYSKLHITNNTMFACNVWGLRVSDIMQGIVYGVTTEEIDGSDEKLLTRFDVDEFFGTAINRFTAQAVIGHPLTVYGAGGQTRGVIALRDSVQALERIIDNPPPEGDYRVINQFHEVYSINQMAELVKDVAEELGYEVEVTHIENPRVERERHIYQPEAKRLYKFGFKPLTTVREEVVRTIQIVERYKHRIPRAKIMPTVRWRR